MGLDRRAKIKLLLTSLMDASSPSRGASDVRAAFGSRPPAKNEELWAHGSYSELWSCLDAIKPVCPKIHKHTLAFYVSPESWARKSTAEKGVNLLAEMMPANVFVPESVVLATGEFTEKEAQLADRWRDAT